MYQGNKWSVSCNLLHSSACLFFFFFLSCSFYKSNIKLFENAENEGLDSIPLGHEWLFLSFISVFLRHSPLSPKMVLSLRPTGSRFFWMIINHRRLHFKVQWRQFHRSNSIYTTSIKINPNTDLTPHTHPASLRVFV